MVMPDAMNDMRHIYPLFEVKPKGIPDSASQTTVSQTLLGTDRGSVG
jgi:hypothetical protein